MTRNIRSYWHPIALCAVLPWSVFSAERPNLVFVFSDQQSWDMLGCYGNPDVRTPRLDQFAQEGIRFLHCISKSPVCTPYRGMLFSGQHPLKTGALSNDIQMRPGNGRYFAEVLRDHGYRLGYFGKWHLYGGDRVRGVPPGPLRYGFDHEFLINNCTLVFDAKRAYYWSQDGATRLLYGDWEPYAQTRQAIQFIQQHAAHPFALFLSWHPPHNWSSEPEGYGAPDDCLALYDPQRIRLRPSVEDTQKVRRMYQGHMAMITSLDRAFGWLMDALEAHGLKERTIVVFTSDHGDMLLSYGWTRNKGRAEHLSCRVPLLIRWPGRLRPRTSEMLIGTLDLMPTLLGLMGLPVPNECDGHNLAPALLTERDDDAPDAIPLFFYPANWRGLYTRRYTYSVAIAAPDDHPDPASVYNVLYDRQTDPWELTNLFHSTTHANLRTELHARMVELLRSYGDRGWTWRQLLRCLREEDRRNFLLPPAERPRGWEARTAGVPLQLMAGDAGVW